MKECIIDYAGIRIAVSSNDAYIASGLSRFLMAGGCKESKDTQHELLLKVNTAGIPAKSNEILASQKEILFYAAPGFEKKIYFFDNNFLIYCKHDNALFRFDIKGRVIEGWIQKPRVVDDTRFLNVVLMDILHLALSFYGIVFIHSAGVATGKKGVIIAGRMHSGKSIISLKLIQRGFKFLADDMLGLKEFNGKLKMVFSPEYMGLDKKAPKLFTDIRDSISNNGTEITVLSKKIKIPIEKIFPGSIQCIADPKLLVFIKQSNVDILEMFAISKGEALSRLLGGDFHLFDRELFGDLSMARMNTLSCFVESVRPFCITYSLNRLDEVGSLIEDFFNE